MTRRNLTRRAMGTTVTALALLVVAAVAVTVGWVGERELAGRLARSVRLQRADQLLRAAVDEILGELRNALNDPAGSSALAGEAGPAGWYRWTRPPSSSERPPAPVGRVEVRAPRTEADAAAEGYTLLPATLLAPEPASLEPVPQGRIWIMVEIRLPAQEGGAGRSTTEVRGYVGIPLPTQGQDASPQFFNDLLPEPMGRTHETRT